MASYNFETSEFGVSDDGVHLLRSRFNYDTIPFDQIATLTISKGKELNNWMFILMIGVALISFSIWYLVRIINVVSGDQVNVIYVEQILVPIIPGMLGGYCIYSSTRNATVLRVKTIKNKVHKFSLTEIEKQKSLKPFEEYLKYKLHTKLTSQLS